MQCRLCATCWLYWKKYGGLKMPTQSEEQKSPSPTAEVCESGLCRGEKHHVSRLLASSLEAGMPHRTLYK